MSTETTTDVEASSDSQLVVRDATLGPQSSPVLMTSAQAKVDAVAAITMTAYQRASQLVLTPEEVAGLKADFPDEAFKPGAAGKEHLLYLEHPFLRDRLDAVIGMGQWAIVPRSRWAEQFRTAKGTEASRVYLEGMLLIRGCFVAESIGEMEYYPNNASQNYGDACEGAESACLRRCCKKLGIGLQAWKKDWCDGWWQRRRNGSKPSTPVQTPQAPKNATKAPLRPNGGPREATEATRQWMLKELQLYGEVLLHEYATKNGILLDTEDISEWPLNKVPTSKDELRKLMKSIEDFTSGGTPPPSAGTRDHDDNEDDVPYSESESKPVKDESFKSFPIAYGKHAGKKLGDLETKTIWGFWKNHKVETEYEGKTKRPETIAKDQAFRDALDKAGEYYGFTDNA